MSKAAVTISDPTLAKIRAILGLDGMTGEAGEVVLNLTNPPGGARHFQSATVQVEGAYSVSVTTEDTFFLSMRADGALLAHVGPNTSTFARFAITKVSGFEYALSSKETRYTFVEERPGGVTKLHVILRW